MACPNSVFDPTMQNSAQKTESTKWNMNYHPWETDCNSYNSVVEASTGHLMQCAGAISHNMHQSKPAAQFANFH